jgi:hypothetical protein
MQSSRITPIQHVKELARSKREAIAVECKPVIEVRTNRVVGYQTSIGHSSASPTLLNCDNGHHARDEDHGCDLFYLNLQLHKAQEMGFERVFLTIESPLLKSMASIAKPLNMEVVIQLTDMNQLGDLQACQELIATWRVQGFQFAINDFGVGFIGLPLIACLRPDYIMIDFSGMVKVVAYEELQPITNELFPVLKSFARKALVYIP